MTDWNDVARLCLALPEVAEGTLLTDEPDAFFTTTHFDGYPIVLCRLDRLDVAALTELVGEAWACRAPRRLVERHRFDAG